MRPLLFILIFSILGCSFTSSEKVIPLATEPLSKVMNEHNLKPGDVMIFIDKSEYILHLIYESDTIKTYPVVLGTNPVDPKIRQGDRCTPEGEFKIRDMYPHKSWSKFIWIDYPNAHSRKNFNEAKANGLISPDAKIGGEVGIHGTPAGRDDIIENRINWTHGCISVTQDAIDEIYEVVNENTIIKIVQ